MPASSHARIAFIDAAKAICIFLMVVGHTTSNYWLLTYIYSFHMPALFIISGYLYRARPWYKTMVSFSVPVLFFSILNLFIQILLGEQSFSSIKPSQVIFEIVHYRYGLSHGLFMGDWFLWALIGLRWLFGDIPPFRIFRRYYIAIGLFCVAYMTFESHFISIDTVFRGYYIGRMVPSVVFFCIGFYLIDHEWTPKSIPFNVVPLLIVLFIILPIINGRVDINSNTYGISYLLFVLNAAVSSILLFVLSEKVPNTKFLKSISKGTLIVLGTHMPISRILYFMFPEKLAFLFPIITMIFCYYFILFCEKYCPLLLGKGR